MKVAHVISTLDRCGPVNVLYEIVRNLPADIESAIFTLAAEPESSRSADFKHLGLPVTCVVAGRIQSMLSGGRMLRNEMSAFSPEIVHVHGYRATILARDLPYRKLVTVHNCLYEDYLTSYGRFQAELMARTEAAAWRSYDCVVACSNTNAIYLQEHHDSAVEAVRNGIDQGAFYPAAMEEKLALRSMLGFADDKTVIVSTGGCSERKGTLPLLNAFNAINHGTGSAELHIFGGGPDFEACRNLGYDDVVLHGFVDDVVPYLRASDLFVSASRSEGMPLAVLEALCCGLPALLSDIPPHREIEVACDRDSLVTVANLTDESCIREALRRFLTQDHPCLSGEERLDVFSSSVMANSYLSLYEELTRGGRS